MIEYGWWLIASGIIMGAGGMFIAGLLWLNHWLKKYDLVPTKAELQRRERELDKELKI